jgi:putative CocE/NonD family hydrolase
MWKLPLANYPLFNFSDASAPFSTASLAPYFLDWLAHPSYDKYWKQLSIEERFGDITVPILHVAAWYDIFQGGSLRNYVGIKAHGGSEAARRGQHLFVAIGGHAGSGRKIGDVDFGAAAAEFDEDEITLKWYDYLFKGAQNEFAGKPVKIFVMGANQWREEDDWPLARAQSTKYFLHSTKSELAAWGRQSFPPRLRERRLLTTRLVILRTRFRPWAGRCAAAIRTTQPLGPRDQRAVEARMTSWFYSTPAFAQDTEVTGPVSLELFGKSSAVDTDFTAKLVDVGPDGFAQKSDGRE